MKTPAIPDEPLASRAVSNELGELVSKPGCLREDKPTRTLNSVSLLRMVFGDQIVNKVAIELGLVSIADQALPPQLADRAMAMCNVCKSSFAGLNFVSGLMLSPASNTLDFRATVREAGVDPDALSDQSRLRIDRLFTHVMEEATCGDHNCIDLDKARMLLREVIAICQFAWKVDPLFASNFDPPRNAIFDRIS